MAWTRMSEALLRLLPWGLMVAVFVTDLLTPLGLAHGALYLLVLLVAQQRSDSHLACLTLAGVALTWVGFYLAPAPQAGTPMSLVVANRVFTTSILVAAWLLLQRLRSAERRADAQSAYSRKLDARLQRQRIESERLEALSELTGGLAHDINNLLAIIGTNTALLYEECPDSGPAREALDVIQRALDRGGRLMKSLQSFACRQLVEPVATDLERFLYSSEPMLAQVLGPHRLQFHADGNLPPVSVDPAWLDISLVNLLKNAGEALQDNPDGRVEVRLVGWDRLPREDAISGDDTFSLGWPDGQPGHPFVEIRVSDNGRGIDPDNLDRIFEPFFSRRRSGQGSGLGLAMVFGFMRQSGGCLAVHSRLGVGTEFRLWLPCLEGDSGGSVPYDAPANGDFPGLSKTTGDSRNER